MDQSGYHYREPMRIQRSFKTKLHSRAKKNMNEPFEIASN